MQGKHGVKFRVLSLLESDSHIRVLIMLEILQRSGLDFQEVMKNLFSRTWEYKILEAFMKYGQMHKAEICSKLFPKLNDSHYKLSRPNQVSRAYNNLLNNSILIEVEDFGRKKIYDVSPSYKPVLQAIFIGNIFALLES